MDDAKQSDLGGASVDYDLVIVGAGISGGLVAKFFALADPRHRVLILEAGDEIKPNINEALERYYESTSKVPESPYTPEIFASTAKDPNDRIERFAHGQRSDAVLRNPSSVNAGRPTVLSVSMRAWQTPQKAQWWKDAERAKCDPKNPDVNYFEQAGVLPFASTYERIAGGTARHWMGISLRHLPNDFRMGQQYVAFTDRNGMRSPWPDWPIDYMEMDPWYARAESEIGVSGDAEVQQQLEEKLQVTGGNLHGYPMAGIPLSYSDKKLNLMMHGRPVTFPVRSGQKVELEVTQLPVARNSEPFNRRRACAGNSSCIPICPIQAKYDPTITLREACNTGRVQIEYRAVACDVATVATGPGQSVTHIEYIKYRGAFGGPSERRRVRAKTYILAANAIETPRLMLMSNGRKGVLSREAPVGRYLMDHPFFIASAKSKEPVYPYRGPLVTAGIEMLRDGDFRRQHASFRVDVSNSGWSLTSHGSAQAIAEDFITGSNNSGQNPGNTILGGAALMTALNELLTRQISLGFLVEQTPDRENRVTLSDKFVDGLGLPRPRIEYDFSIYTKDGLAEAVALARNIFKATGCDPYPDEPGPHLPVPPDNSSFEWVDAETRDPIVIRYMGAGHIAGTCRMGTDPNTSVVDQNLKLWGVDNLYVIGSSVFPTLGTANPTLTIAALALRLADHVASTSKATVARPA